MWLQKGIQCYLPLIVYKGSLIINKLFGFKQACYVWSCCLIDWSLHTGNLLLVDINDLNNPDHRTKHIPPSSFLCSFSYPIFLFSILIQTSFLPTFHVLPLTCSFFFSVSFSNDRGHSWNKGCFCSSWASRMEREGGRAGFKMKRGGKERGQRVRWGGREDRSKKKMEAMEEMGCESEDMK